MLIKPLHLPSYLLSAVFHKFTENYIRLLIRGIGFVLLITCLSLSCIAADDEDLDFLNTTGLFGRRTKEDFKMTEKDPSISAMDWLAWLDTTRNNIKGYIHSRIQIGQTNSHAALWAAYFMCSGEISFTIAGKHGLSARRATPEEAQLIFGYIAGTRQDCLGAKNSIRNLYFAYDLENCEKKMAADPRFAAHMAVVAMVDAAAFYTCIPGPVYDLNLQVIPTSSRTAVMRAMLSAISSPSSITSEARSQLALFVVTTILPEDKERYRNPEEMQALENSLSTKNLLETAADYMTDAILRVNTEGNGDLLVAVEKFEQNDLHKLFKQFSCSLLRKLSDSTPRLKDLFGQITLTDMDEDDGIKGMKLMLGDPEACYEQAIDQSSEAVDLDLYEMILAVWQGHGPALFELGKAYDDETYGLPKNLALRNACFEKAAACGNIKGFEGLATDPSFRRIAEGSLKGLADHNISPLFIRSMQEKLLRCFQDAYDRKDKEALTLFPQVFFDHHIREANSDFFLNVYWTLLEQPSLSINDFREIASKVADLLKEMVLSRQIKPAASAILSVTVSGEPKSWGDKDVSGIFSTVIGNTEAGNTATAIETDATHAVAVAA